MRQILALLMVFSIAQVAGAQAPPGIQEICSSTPTVPLPPGAVPYSCYPGRPIFTPFVPRYANPYVPQFPTPYSFGFSTPPSLDAYFDPRPISQRPALAESIAKNAEREERKEAERQERLVERRQASEDRRQARRETVNTTKASPDQRAKGMLQIAQRFLDDGDVELGRKWLEKLVTKYPFSDSATKAKSLLAEL